MTTLDDKISLLETEQRDLFAAKRPIDERLTVVYNTLSDLRNERDLKMLEERTDKDELNFDIMLKGDPSSRAWHKEQERLLSLINLSKSGYYVDTKQAAIQISLNKKDTTQTDKVYTGLCTVLPYLIPSKKEGEGVRIDIFEHTLCEHTSYTLHILGNTPTSPCELRTTYSTIGSFRTLREALSYIQEHHWHYGEEGGYIDEDE